MLMKTHVKPGQLCSLTETVCEMQWRPEIFPKMVISASSIYEIATTD